MPEDHIPLPPTPNSDFLGQLSRLHTVTPQRCVTASFFKPGLGLPLGNSVLRTFLPFDRENGSKTHVLRLAKFCFLSAPTGQHRPQAAGPFLALQSPSQASFLCDFHFPRGLVCPLPSPSSVVALPCPTWLHFLPQSEKWRLHLNSHRSGEFSLAVTGAGYSSVAGHFLGCAGPWVGSLVVWHLPPPHPSKVRKSFSSLPLWCFLKQYSIPLICKEIYLFHVCLCVPKSTYVDPMHAGACRHRTERWISRRYRWL